MCPSHYQTSKPKLLRSTFDNSPRDLSSSSFGSQLETSPTMIFLNFQYSVTRPLIFQRNNCFKTLKTSTTWFGLQKLIEETPVARLGRFFLRFREVGIEVATIPGHNSVTPELFGIRGGGFRGGAGCLPRGTRLLEGLEGAAGFEDSSRRMTRGDRRVWVVGWLVGTLALRKREHGWMASDSDFRREFRPIRRNQAKPPLIIRLPPLRVVSRPGPISNRPPYLPSSICRTRRFSLVHG